MARSDYDCLLGFQTLSLTANFGECIRLSKTLRKASVIRSNVESLDDGASAVDDIFVIIVDLNIIVAV
jgi:hypothetical protein